MKGFDWSETKNELLKLTRHVSFEEVVAALQEGRLVARMDHPNQERYPHQQVWLVRIRDYIYAVPFVEGVDKYYMKTIMPNRKYTRMFIFKRKPNS